MRYKGRQNKKEPENKMQEILTQALINIIVGIILTLFQW